MDPIRRGLSGWLLALALGLLAGCGGGGGGGSAAPATPAAPAPARDLKLLGSTLPDQSVAVPLEPTFLFTFDADVTLDGIAGRVRMTDGTGPVPLTVDVLTGVLRVRPSQPLKMRMAYTLTVDAGLTGVNGAVLPAELVRRFKTVLVDAQVALIRRELNESLVGGWNRMRIGDLDGDGRPEIVEFGGDPAIGVYERGFAINIYTRTATGDYTRTHTLFREPVPVALQSYTDLALVDLDHDGILEIVVAVRRYEPEPSGLIVFKRGGDGRYAIAQFVELPYVDRLLSVDIDRDGRPDLLTRGNLKTLTSEPRGCGLQAVLSSRGGARVQPATEMPCVAEAVVGALASRERNHLVTRESRTDFDSPNPAPVASRLRIYALDLQGRPTLDAELMAAAASVCSGFVDCSRMGLMDADGDGLQDLLFGSAVTPGDQPSFPSVVYVRDRSTGRYAEFLRQVFGNFVLMPGDVDRDGRDDLVAVGHPSPATAFALALNRAPAGFELSHLVYSPSPTATVNDETVAIADLDGDGLLDAVVQSSNLSTVIFYQRLR